MSSSLILFITIVTVIVVGTSIYIYHEGKRFNSISNHEAKQSINTIQKVPEYDPTIFELMEILPKLSKEKKKELVNYSRKLVNDKKQSKNTKGK